MGMPKHLSRKPPLEYCSKFITGHNSTQGATGYGSLSTYDTENKWENDDTINAGHRISTHVLPDDLNISIDPLKKSLKSRRFMSDIEVQKAVSDLFHQQKEGFYQRVKPGERMDDYRNAQGDFAWLAY